MAQNKFYNTRRNGCNENTNPLALCMKDVVLMLTNGRGPVIYNNDKILLLVCILIAAKIIIDDQLIILWADVTFLIFYFIINFQKTVAETRAFN